MNRIFHLISVCLVVLVTLLSMETKFQYRKMSNKNYSKGEILNYRIHYGFITAGTAEVTVSPKLYTLNDRICYRMDVVGQSLGSFDYFIRIRDTWRSYIDTSAIVPHKFFRHIEEGRYRKTEEVFYNHPAKNLRVIDKNRKIDKNYKVPENVQDVVSGFYFLRNIEMKKLKVNDTIKVPGFLEDVTYDLQLVYRGKGVIKNRLGKFNALMFAPIMPENSLFDGENSVRVWISDDENRVPLKMEADMFVGAVEVDLENYSGLKYPLKQLK